MAQMMLSGKESYLPPPKKPLSGKSGGRDDFEVAPFVVAVDSREQMPFLFRDLPERLKIQCLKKGLKTGDYSICGLEKFVTVERKSKADLFGSVSAGRDRFEREMQRLAKIPRCCVVVEASMEEILEGLGNSQMSPVNVLLTGIAWAGRWRVPWWFCHDRKEAEWVTFQFLRFAWKDAMTAIENAVKLLQARTCDYENHDEELMKK